MDRINAKLPKLHLKETNSATLETPEATIGNFPANTATGAQLSATLQNQDGNFDVENHSVQTSESCQRRGPSSLFRVEFSLARR